MNALLGLLVATSLIPSFPERTKTGLPYLRSESAIVRFADTKEVLLAKNAEAVRAIASVTKLLSGLVIAKEGAFSDHTVVISEEDKDRLKWSRSRIKIGRAYKPLDLFEAALGASDNRAMYASVRARGVARSDFVVRMNALARELGMASSSFFDPAGIHPKNLSTASDLLHLIEAASESDRVRQCTLLPRIDLIDDDARVLTLANPNRLIRSPEWDIVVGKTGYTVEAGRALVLRSRIADRMVDMVFLGAHEMASVFGDAARVRRWLLEKPRGTIPVPEKKDVLLVSTSSGAISSNTSSIAIDTGGDRLFRSTGCSPP